AVSTRLLIVSPYRSRTWALLEEQPLEQIRRGIGTINAVVVADPAEFGIERAPADRLDGLYHVARLLGGDDLVRVAMETPARNVLALFRFVGLPSVAYRHDRGPACGLLSRQAPGPLAPHGLSGERHASHVDPVFLLYLVQNGQCPFAARRLGCPILAFAGLRE